MLQGSRSGAQDPLEKDRGSTSRGAQATGGKPACVEPDARHRAPAPLGGPLDRRGEEQVQPIPHVQERSRGIGKDTDLRGRQGVASGGRDPN